MRKKKKNPKLVQKWEREIEKASKEVVSKRKSPMRDFEREAKTLHDIDKKFPEFKEPESPDVEGKEIKNFQMSYEETDKGTGKPKKTLLENIPMRKTEFIIKENPLTIFLCNISSGKIYFDLKTEEFYFYTFTKRGKDSRISKRIKLDNHDILELMAFCLHSVYGVERMLKPRARIRISPKMKERIARIETRERKRLEKLKATDLPYSLTMMVLEFLNQKKQKHEENVANEQQEIEVHKT